jgi:phospholipase/carboxylesterase
LLHSSIKVKRMLDYEFTEIGTELEYCVIWMHGLGADGNDFTPIVPELNLPESPGIRFIFPHAPMQPVTINGGFVMRAWYDIIAPDLTARQDQDGILNSADAVNEIIHEQIEGGFPANKIILAGFSQGGAMALHIGLRTTENFAGILALSTYLPLAEDVPVPPAAQHNDIPIFMAHGSYDPVIPINAAQISKQRLTDLGYQIEWKDYPMEHSVCAEEIGDISQWFQQTTGSAN